MQPITPHKAKGQNQPAAILSLVMLCCVMATLLTMTKPAMAQGKYEIFPRDPKAVTNAQHNTCSLCPCKTPIVNNHKKIRAHVTDEFIKHRDWMIDEFFTKHVRPAMMLMTEQLQAVAMQQMLMIGSFFDAKHQLETQRLMQQMMAQAHKDYQPSEGLCEIGTGVRSLSASSRKTTVGHVALAKRVMERQLRNKDSISGPADNGDMKSRIANFKTKYCSTKDNGNGLTLLCGQDAPKERRNKDANFSQTLEGPISLKADFVEMAQNNNNGGNNDQNNTQNNTSGNNIAPFLFGDDTGQGGDENAPTPGSNITVFSQDFEQNVGEFTYSDGGFGGSDPGSYNHAFGTRRTDGPDNNTGYIEVFLDGVIDTLVEDIAGSWRRSFSLDQAIEDVELTFQYKLFHASENDINEDAYIMVEVNGTRYGTGAQDYIQIARGSSGETSTNFRSITLNIDDIPTGSNSVRLGIYKSASNVADEDSSAAFDNITLTGTIKADPANNGNGNNGNNNNGNNGGGGNNGNTGNNNGSNNNGNNNNGGNNGNGNNNTATNENADGEDLFAMMANLFGHEPIPFKGRRLLADGNGNPYPNAYTYLDLRSAAAKRSVAQNGFSALAAMRSEGDEESNAGRFLKRLVVELGVPEEEVEELLGKNPSYFAQMEVLGKKIYQNPVFFTELYDKPTNVLRKQAAIRAQNLMQERDLYESLLRSEMALAVTLESMLHTEHVRVYGELDKLQTRLGGQE